jgi:sulfur-carrier protein
MVTLRIFLQAPLDTLASMSKEGEPIQAETVYGALIDICASHPRLHERLFNGKQLSPYIHIFLNGELVPTDKCKDQLIVDNDELCLLSAIRGG